MPLERHLTATLIAFVGGGIQLLYFLNDLSQLVAGHVATDLFDIVLIELHQPSATHCATFPEAGPHSPVGMPGKLDIFAC